MEVAEIQTEEVQPCMSKVVRQWIIGIQDEIPASISNSQRWLDLLPLAAGTGRDYEQERLKLVMDWMWSPVLTHIQPVANELGFGSQWLEMTTKRTSEAALAASKVALAKATSNVAKLEAEWATRCAANSAEWAADAVADAVADAAKWAAKCSAWAAMASRGTSVAWATCAAARAAAWEHFDPCGLLENLIAVDSK